ncbi:MAG: hypothetical protein AAGF84_07050 [Planctomycetota bacterium]
MVRSFIKQLFTKGSTPQPTFHTSEYGNYYAKIPLIVASLENDTCPLLRSILVDDLKCGKIIEVDGEGDTWWDFTFKNTRFTCMLLVASCNGSEFYPSSCTQSSQPERELLKELVYEINKFATQRAT